MATLWFSTTPSDAPTAQNLKDDDLPTPTPSECSDYWDPPCRVCKKVDNESNVLCDICNGAYHLECIANLKPPLPRKPDDDEWFCRTCIKRGIPESIIDRVGRRPTYAMVRMRRSPPHGALCAPRRARSHGTRCPVRLPHSCPYCQGVVRPLPGQVGRPTRARGLLGGSRGPRHAVEPVRRIVHATAHRTVR